MKLPLIYPTKDLKTINIGILGMKVVRVLSNETYIKDGTLPYEILLAVCKNTTREQIEQLSLVDSHRIMLAAWEQTHGKKKYISKQYCECGKLVIATHSTEINYDRPNIYDEVAEIEAIDADTLEQRIYTIKLRPIPLSLQADMLSIQSLDTNNTEALQDLLLWCRIESVDGKKDFDKDSIPIPLYTKISELGSDDVDAITNMLQQKVKCSCGEEIISTISWTDGIFLQDA